MLTDVASRASESRLFSKRTAHLTIWLWSACLLSTALSNANTGEAQDLRGPTDAILSGATDKTLARGVVAKDRSLRSLCPGTGDLQDVRDYDGSLGQTQAFVTRHKNPVGRIAANQLCSGTLIARDLFLTAGHCVDAIRVGSSNVDFNYEKLAGEDGTAPFTSSRIVRVVEDGRPVSGLDYAIFELEGNPGDAFGVALIEEFTPAEGHLITIIQHPMARRKEIEVGRAKGFSHEAIFYDDLDTEIGSSGAGILDDAGRLVGVHTGGKCDLSSSNQGVRMDRIIEASATVRSLLPGTLLARKAKVSRLQVQDFGAGPMDTSETVDAEALAWLEGFGDELFFFNLRSGTDGPTHLGMFSQLRHAYRANLPIRLEYYREGHRKNRVLRVIATTPAPVFQRPTSNITTLR